MKNVKIAFISFVFAGLTLGVMAQNKIWNLVNSSGSDVIAVTDQGNLTISGTATAASVSGTSVSATSVTVSGATGIVSTAAALVAPTNTASAGLRVRINGTNYVIALYPN